MPDNLSGMRQNKRANSRAFVLLLLLLTVIQNFCMGQSKIQPVSGDEAEIRALEERFVAAFNAGDIEAIMRNYLQDSSFVIFDVVPRKEYRGGDTYRRNWEDFFSHFKGLPNITISDLGITADDLIGFGHSIQRIRGVDVQGRAVDRTVRVTDGYRKIDGKWLIALEHVSVPLDLATGKAETGAKP